MSFDPLQYADQQSQQANTPPFNPLDYASAKVGAPVTATSDTPAGSNGVLPQIFQLGSGAYHSIVGGYKGLFSLATGEGLNKAANAVENETSKSYIAPPSDLSSKLATPVQSQIRAMNAPMSPSILGDIAANHGASPGVSAFLATAPTAFGLMAGARTGPEAPPISGAQDVVNQAVSPQSMGAAAAAPDITKATPALQQAIVEAGQQGKLNSTTLGRHLEADSLPIPIQLTKGQASGDVVQLSKEQNMRAGQTAFAEHFKEQNAKLIDNLDEIRREAAPTAVGNDPIQNGQALLDKYKAYDAPIKADITAKYQALTDANGGAVPIDSGAFLDNVESSLKKNYLTSSVPPAGMDLINSLKSGEPLDFEGFEAARSRLAEAQRNGGSQAVAAGIIRNQLEQMPLSSDAANLKGLADQARSAAKARFQAIDADPAYKAAVNDDTPMGEQSPLADKFVNKYVLSGTKAGLQQMQTRFANDPDALGTIKAASLNYLKTKAGINPYTNEGNFSQAGYNRALTDIEPRMDQLLDPQTAQQVRTLGNVARYTQFQPRGSFVNNSNTFTAYAGNAAMNAAEGIANVKAGGIPVGTALRKVLTGKAAAKAAEEALKPGAGLNE